MIITLYIRESTTFKNDILMVEKEKKVHNQVLLQCFIGFSPFLSGWVERALNSRVAVLNECMARWSLFCFRYMNSSSFW